ncbi:hypothetical protein HAX54_039002 [Datura stramonium]|uniref:Uncharacterized protein n=1 Tax=Datura stramonium TaxID=4076 RepID=A0ABS8VKJ0_DATST|nr:hypothetical protein [Datura stramonium]
MSPRANSKAQEAAAATSSPLWSDEGSDEAESDGDNPPVDNAEKGNDDAEDSGDDDTNAEESGDKDSVVEESNEQVEDSDPATTPEARTIEYDYRMKAMKGIITLRTKDMVLHFQWMDNIIIEYKEGAEWVTGKKPIYKASLNFLAKSW